MGLLLLVGLVPLTLGLIVARRWERLVADNREAGTGAGQCRVEGVYPASPGRRKASPVAATSASPGNPGRLTALVLSH